MALKQDVEYHIDVIPAEEASFPNWQSDDYEIVSKSELFIDKTLLIKDILNNTSPYLLITTPKGFGKSTNLNMIRRFVEMNINKKNGKIGLERDSLNYTLFKKGRLISSDKEFMNNNFAKYAVIHMSFNDIYDNSIELLIEKYAEALSKIFINHKYLLKSDKITSEDKETISKYIDITFCKKLPRNDIETGITFLAKMLSLHCPNNKIFAFIDDYDYPLFELIIDRQISNENETEYLSFIRNIFANILSPNRDIHRVLITGKSTVGATLFPPDSPVEVCEFLMDHQFSEYYGVTPGEIDLKLEKFNKERNTKISLIAIHGYVTLGTKIIINTRPFVQFLVNNKIDYYSSSVVNLPTAISSDVIRYILDKSLMDSWLAFPFQPYDMDSINDIRRICIYDYRVEEYLSVKYHSYIHLFRELGYFKIRKGKSENLTLLKAATEDIRKIFDQSLRIFYGISLTVDINMAATQFNLLLPHKQYFLELAKTLQKIYRVAFEDAEPPTASSIYLPFLVVLGKSFYNVTPEHFTSDTGAVIANGFHTIFDVTGINIVIKYMSTAEDALKEIIHNTTEAQLEQVKQYEFLGINFDETFLPSFGLIVDSKNMDIAVYYNF